MDGIFWLLLPVAAYSGWYIAAKQFRPPISNKETISRKPIPNYNEGFNNLISEQTDKAVDIVIEKVDVTPDSVEVHLALGSIFRKNGEVDRAIRLHQNLMEKHAISQNQRESVLFELAQDYLSAGLLDRAERIFIDLLTTQQFEKDSLLSLVQVYQHEKEWKLAIEYSQRYENLTRKSQKTIIGHFYCEMSEVCLAKDELEQARDLLAVALKEDKQCVRANMLLGKLNYESQMYSSALKNYIAIIDQDREFFPEIFEKFIDCYQCDNSRNTLIPLLPGYQGNAVKVTPIDSTVNEGNINKKLIKFIDSQLESKPSVKLLGQYLLLNLEESTLNDRQLVTRIKQVFFKLKDSNPSYHCNKCGYSAHSLQWQCPSCKNWSSIKPN